MLSFFPGLSRGRSADLPARRWAMRSPQRWLWAVVGALAGGAIPFYFWWIELIPLWIILLPMLAGALILLPAPLVLGIDERGVAVILPGWLRDRTLWIPIEQLIDLDIEAGWLLASGSKVERQGDLDVIAVVRQMGSADVPHHLELVMNSPIADRTLAFPLTTLDGHARDEIELWLFRTGEAFERSSVRAFERK